MHVDKKNLKQFQKPAEPAKSLQNNGDKRHVHKGCFLHYCLSLHSQWFSVLSQVHASTEQEIREMHDEQANPQNAVVSQHLKKFSEQIFSENKGHWWQQLLTVTT